MSINAKQSLSFSVTLKGSVSWNLSTGKHSGNIVNWIFEKIIFGVISKLIVDGICKLL